MLIKEWDLDNIRELLDFTRKNYLDTDFEKVLIEVVNSYHRQLQEMKLGRNDKEAEELRERIHELLFPSLQILEIKSEEKFHYQKSKIYQYLLRSQETSASKLFEKMKIYPKEWFGDIKENSFEMNSTSGEWGIFQLLYIVEKFPEFNFKFENDDNVAYTDKELYFQFIFKVFEYSRKHKSDADIVGGTN